MITVNGHSCEWTKNLTVKELLEKRKYTFPSIVVKINNRVVEPENFAVTFIVDGDDVKVIHLITGG